MFVLVAYDISSTRRRNKIAKVLSRYGDRVNLSVFECEFKTAAQFFLEEVFNEIQDNSRNQDGDAGK